MDPQTRIGIGATALFTVAAASISPAWWWASVSVMGLSGMVAAWGLWPLVGSLAFGHFLLWRVPLTTAAQICFERTERRFAGSVIGTEYRDENERISFLYSSFVARRIPMFGRTPPSRVARQIPEPALRNLTLVEGTNSLRSIRGQQRVEYLDCYMLRPALWKHVRHLRRAKRPEDI